MASWGVTGSLGSQDMVMIDFEKFAHILKPIIGGGSNTGAFARTLLDAITSEKGKSALDSVKLDTYKRYYNGRVQISDMAKRISPYLDEEEFVDFISELDDDPAIRVVDAFEPYIEGIDKQNYSTELAAYFKQILMTAANQSSQEAGADDLDEGAEQVKSEIIDNGDNHADGNSVTVVNQNLFINSGNGFQFVNSNAPITLTINNGAS